MYNNDECYYLALLYYYLTEQGREVMELSIILTLIYIRYMIGISSNFG